MLPDITPAGIASSITLYIQRRPLRSGRGGGEGTTPEYNITSGLFRTWFPFFRRTGLRSVIINVGDHRSVSFEEGWTVFFLTYFFLFVQMTFPVPLAPAPAAWTHTNTHSQPFSFHHQQIKIRWADYRKRFQSCADLYSGAFVMILMMMMVKWTVWFLCSELVIKNQYYIKG